MVSSPVKFGGGKRSDSTNFHWQSTPTWGCTVCPGVHPSVPPEAKHRHQRVSALCVLGALCHPGHFLQPIVPVSKSLLG